MYVIFKKLINVSTSFHVLQMFQKYCRILMQFIFFHDPVGLNVYLLQSNSMT